MRPFVALSLVPLLAFGTIAAAAPASATGLSGTVSVAQIFSALPVVAPVTTGYDRALFSHWIDADGNGCDTRQEVLIEESLVPVVMGSGCSVLSGQWNSWYDGATWTNPSDVDIDHFVPLSEAWKSGANAWTPDQRRAFANDLDFEFALEAVTDNVNQSKSDQDPATWVPPLVDAGCRYATDWVLVKYRWGLAIDSAEHAALEQQLAGSCGLAQASVPSTGASAIPAAGGSFERLAGIDRYATSVAVAGQYPSSVPVVYVASGANFPDALSAAPAAALQGGPLLLTTPTSLPTNVRNEIARLAPDKIVVVGGNAAVSATVYKALATLAPTIRRDSGLDRFETSRIINRNAFPAGTTAGAFIATGNNFPDALSASAAAGSSARPVILVNGSDSSVDTATAGLIAHLGVKNISIAGGTAVVSSSMESSLRASLGLSVQRLAGADRFATSSVINRASFSTAPTVYFAVGTGFADALSGAALAGRDGAPLFVVGSACIPDYVAADLAALGTTNRVLLGGPSALNDSVGNLTVCAPPVVTPPPAVTPPPVVTPPGPTQPANPGDTKNCGDFATYQEAKAWFDTYYRYYGDVARLDADNDLRPCESLPGG